MIAHRPFQDTSQGREGGNSARLNTIFCVRPWKGAILQRVRIPVRQLSFQPLTSPTLWPPRQSPTLLHYYQYFGQFWQMHNERKFPQTGHKTARRLLILLVKSRANTKDGST